MPSAAAEWMEVVVVVAFWVVVVVRKMAPLLFTMPL